MGISTQVQEERQNQKQIHQEPMTKFLCALKSKEAKRQYPQIQQLKLDGAINQQATDFLLNGKHNPQWIEERLMDFVGFQLERVSRGEIAEATIRNYYKATKRLCSTC